MISREEAQRWHEEARRREAAGDVDGAAAALRIALHIDPGYHEASAHLERLMGSRAFAPAQPGAARREGPSLLEYDVAYPERLSRWRIFVKWLLAIPHLVVLYLFSLAAFVVAVPAWFAVLVTGRYPHSMFEFVRQYLFWAGKAAAYVLLRDEYPPFGGDPYPPVTFELGEPARLSRWLLWVKWLLIWPNALVLTYVVWPAFLATALMALVAVPLTGRYPLGLFRFAVGTVRWQLRLYAYVYFLTDRYPPFDMRTGDGPQPSGSELQPATWPPAGGGPF